MGKRSSSSLSVNVTTESEGRWLKVDDEGTKKRLIPSAALAALSNIIHPAFWCVPSTSNCHIPSSTIQLKRKGEGNNPGARTTEYNKDKDDAGRFTINNILLVINRYQSRYSCETFN